MAFTNRLRQVTPGFGTISVDQSREDVDLTASADILLPASGGFTPKVRSGFARFKATVDGGTSPTVALIVRVSDGTTVRNVANFPASQAGDEVDVIIPILADFDFDRLVFDAVTGGTAPDYNVDIAFVGTVGSS